MIPQLDEEELEGLIDSDRTMLFDMSEFEGSANGDSVDMSSFGPPRPYINQQVLKPHISFVILLLFYFDYLKCHL